jgi:glycerophosphoryl diester phosphodiesterase
VRKLKFALVLCFVFTLSGVQAQVLKNGHAHNDYWHAKPLIQAMDAGFMSVEVDVHLLKGDILVNHEAIFTRKGRNLEKLYLQPLFEMAKANQFKSVYADGPEEFIVYLDVKQGCPGIHDTLITQLKSYQQMLTVWEDGVKKIGAVSVIIGDCGRREEWVSAEKRWFYFDAHLDAIDNSLDADFIPRVSSNLRAVTKWRGAGEMPLEDEEKIREIVEQAHAKGRTVRFWAGSNRPKVWDKLLDLGVDWINVDRLKKFQRFMKKRQERIASLKD